MFRDLDVSVASASKTDLAAVGAPHSHLHRDTGGRSPGSCFGMNELCDFVYALSCPGASVSTAGFVKKS